MFYLELYPFKLMVVGQVVYVWVLDWYQYFDKKALYWDMLSCLEKQKIKKLVCQHDQDRFIVTRGLLRLLISQFIHCAPKAVEFAYTQYGKPELLGGGLQFNLSHSRNWVVYAFCKDKKIGIDIEYQKTTVAIESLAKRYFSEEENKVFLNLNKHNRGDAFFNAWVQKEAIVKALGLRLQGLLSQISVGAKHLDVKGETHQRIESGGLINLLLYPIEVPSQFKSALAVLADSKFINVQQFRKVIF